MPSIATTWMPSWINSPKDCVFYMPRGSGARGDRFVGKQEMQAGLSKRFEGIPDVHYREDRHWVCGDFGVSEWTLTGTSTTGQRIEVRGVGLLEFASGKITHKDSFWKLLALSLPLGSDIDFVFG